MLGFFDSAHMLFVKKLAWQPFFKYTGKVYSFCIAPVDQWIDRRPPKPKIWVRVPTGAPPPKKSPVPPKPVCRWTFILGFSLSFRLASLFAGPCALACPEGEAEASPLLELAQLPQSCLCEA